MLLGLRVVVVGGGVGGLTAALAMAQRGAQVTLFERAPQIRELGAGLQISPNGMAVLSALGVAPALASRSVAGQAVTLRDGRSGRAVLRLDLTTLADAGPWLFVHRGDLVAVLAAAAREAGVTIHTGCPVTALDADADPAGLVLDNGRRVAADLVVAADGVRSVLRGAVDDGPEPAFTGQTAWRALVPLDAPAPPEAAVHMGAGRHLVTYPLRDRRVMNVVAVQERAAWTAEDWMQTDDPANLRRAFADFAPPIRDLLARVDQVGHWGLFRHPVAQRWHRHGCALLGDAAHPTLPFLAQGGCMAIEDAWVLADCLAQSDGVTTALALYQSLRRDRCVRIVGAADFNAFAYHLRPAPLRLLAHAGLRLGGALRPGAALSRFDWLYRHDVTA